MAIMVTAIMGMAITEMILTGRRADPPARHSGIYRSYFTSRSNSLNSGRS